MRNLFCIDLSHFILCHFCIGKTTELDHHPNPTNNPNPYLVAVRYGSLAGEVTPCEVSIIPFYLLPEWSAWIPQIIADHRRSPQITR